MTNTHNSENEPRPRGAGVAARDFASSLRSLLEIAKAVRSGADVDSVLDAIARVVGETLGFQTVVLNVYRPEWDDFYVATVHGNDPVRDALLGSVYEWSSWTPLLAERFARGGVYSIPHDAFYWSQDVGTRSVPAGSPAVDGPAGWHRSDGPYVPREHPAGRNV